MARITLNQLAQSRIPGVVGACRNDIGKLASYANEAIQRLVFEGGETGFSGGWQKVVFEVDPNDPYIVCPREFVRLVNADVCRWPVKIANEWYEFMDGGPGLQKKCECPTDCCTCGPVAIYDRGTVPTAVELSATNQFLRVYPTDVRDTTFRILISGAKDQNGLPIYTQDGLNPVNGFYLTFTSPFATSSFIVTDFANILKDATFGDVILKQVDATTGAEVQLSRYAPDELAPNYRKYELKNLPRPTAPETTIQVTAMAKLEFIPAVRGTDFLLIGNIPALKEEIESIRYSEVDNPASQQMSILKHRNAVRLLNAELRHTQGEQNPAVTFPISGVQGLRRQRVGYMT